MTWQAKGCELLKKHIPHFYVALPCRYTETHPLFQFRMKGKENHFDRQTTWERYYIQLAAHRAKKGCIIFWLPCESKENPRTDGKPYAMDTRGELREWRGRMMADKKLRVVVGAEPDFPGLSQIEHNFNQALCKPFPIRSTLGEIVTIAVAKVR